MTTSTYQAVNFIFSGSNPVQTGVLAEAIVPERAALLRGRVMDRSGQPLAGVRVSTPRHPEYGQTLTRADGAWDLVVNGGGHVLVDFNADERLPSQRRARPRWGEWVVMDDVVLVELDSQVTVIAAGHPEPQVHVASVVLDDEGERANTLYFPPEVEAMAVLSDGSSVPLASLSVRATEYTVGPSGPAAMPADLPANVAYTYAVELSADEALGGRVHFDRTVYNYLDNYLGLPVGTRVPSGTYHRDRGAWVGNEFGTVIELLAIDGDLALIDSTGDGLADDPDRLVFLDLTETERRSLASLYVPGDQLWRMPLEGFSPVDYNFIRSFPSDVTPPPPLPPLDLNITSADPCEQEGSVIECPSQVLGMSIPVAGTALRLNYRSDRVPGRRPALRIPLSLNQVGGEVNRIEVAVSVAGRRFVETYPPLPNLVHEFVWDGLDAFGRPVMGDQLAEVTVTYFQPITYWLFGGTCPFEDWAFSFPGCVFELISRITRQDAVSSRYELTLAGPLDARGFGIGGWTLDGHHLYDRVSERVHLGQGSRSAARQTRRLQRVAGQRFVGGYSGDDGPAPDARIGFGWGLAAGSDGSIFISDIDHHVVRRVGPDGIIETVAGGNGAGYSGDGGPAVDAQLREPTGLALGPDGSLYIADAGNHVIRRIDPDGRIHTFAGTVNRAGDWHLRGEGEPALQARFRNPTGIAVDGEGNVYVGDGGFFGGAGGVFRIGTNGILRTLAGDGTDAGTGGTQDGPGHEVPVAWVTAIGFGPQGDVFYSDTGAGRIKRIDTEGIVHVVAGNGGFCGSNCPVQEGVNALEARVSPHGVVVDRDGTVFFNCYIKEIVYRIDRNGLLVQVAGDAVREYADFDEWPATGVSFVFGVWSLAIGPQGLLIQDFSSILLLPDNVQKSAAFQIVSQDGREIWQFDDSGRHWRSLNALTGAVLREFGYDAEGLLVQITDFHGNVTSIVRDADGQPTAIIAPFGQVSALTVNQDGFLTGLAAPGQQVYAMAYDDDGLLTGFSDPGQREYVFEYDALGRLIRDVGPHGGEILISRTDRNTGYDVNYQSAEGRLTRYEVSSFGETQIIRVTDPAGAVTVSRRQTDGSQRAELPDGRVVRTWLESDPRFGLDAAMLQSRLTGPGGLDVFTESWREVALQDPDDPLSLIEITATTRTNGREQISRYEAATRTMTHTTPAGEQVVQVLDEAGRIVSSSTGVGLAPIERTFNARGLLETVEVDGSTSSFTYDAAGRLVAGSDALGRVHRYTYDEADRLIELEHPSGRRVRTQRDALGRAIAIVLPSDVEHEMSWTPRSQLSGYRPPGEQAFSQFIHDFDGNLVQSIVPGRDPIEFVYEASGRSAEINYAEAEILVAYGDATPRPQMLARSGTHDGSSHVIELDYVGVALSELRYSGDSEGEFAFAYDSNGFLIGMTAAVGHSSEQWTIARDEDGRLTGTGPIAISRAGPGGTPDRFDFPGFALALTHDNQARQTARELRDDNDVPIARIGVEYNAIDWVVGSELTIGAGTEVSEYQYDDDGQLESVLRDTVVVEAYSYDFNGNRIESIRNGQTVISIYDEQDRMLSHDGIPYLHDAAGFLLQRGAETLSYSARGELLQVEGGFGTVQYRYDAFNRRVARIDGGGDTLQYLYGNPSNPMQVTATVDAQDIVSFYFYDHFGLLIAMQRDGQIYGVLSDQVGSPRVIADASGQILRRIDYDAFGRITADTNPAFELAVGFGGGIPDPVTGLIRLGLRDHDPETGRWTARDPMLFDARQYNLYAYAANNPVSLRDPLGLFCIGASAYAGVGAGFSLCVGGKNGISICAEAGLGAGGGLSIGMGDAQRTGNKAIATMSFKCGKLGVGIESAIDDCGVWTTKGELDIGPVTISKQRNHLTGEFGDAQGSASVPRLNKIKAVERFNDQSGTLKEGQVGNVGCKLEGKVAAQACLSSG